MLAVLQTARRRPLAALHVVALLSAAACGNADRPSLFGSYVPDGGAVEDGAGSIQLGSPSVPMCTIGPEGGVCACADQPLVVDVPNLYFVLDRSGSMAALNKWQSVQSALAQVFQALGPRVAVGAAVFPNPTVLDACSAGKEVFAPARGDVPAGKEGITEAELESTLSRISASGGTPTAATLQSLLPRLTSLSGKTYVLLATDGGPNCDAAATCGVDQCTDNIDGIAGCPGGGPPNCCAVDAGGTPESCLDAQPTIDAVRAIVAAGIPVYVIGVPGSAPYAELLDQLAEAGGTARTGQATEYYAVDSADESALQTALAGIAAQITATCTLDLDHVPPDPGLVNVFLDEQPLPQAGADGWTLDGTTVTIEGASCQKILAGEVLDVRVVAGCPTVML